MAERTWFVGQFVGGGPPEVHENAWVTTMRGLLGKRVVVTLNDDASVQIRGMLIAFTDMGEVCLLHPGTGERTWGWPNLHIAEVPDPGRLYVPEELLSDG